MARDSDHRESALSSPMLKYNSDSHVGDLTPSDSPSAVQECKQLRLQHDAFGGECTEIVPAKSVCCCDIASIQDLTYPASETR